jgi:hypothetical protein
MPSTCLAAAPINLTHKLRMKLWFEHLGMPPDALIDGVATEFGSARELALVGGMAAIIQGAPIVSIDLDILPTP